MKVSTAAPDPLDYDAKASSDTSLFITSHDQWKDSIALFLSRRLDTLRINLLAREVCNVVHNFLTVTSGLDQF